MAVSQGYQCDFIDLVSDDFYCKRCKLVARRLTVAACCTESFCEACIEDTRAEGKPCPECGSTDFTTFEHVKNKKRINCLQVYCSMKERGCVWTGPLEELDTHLDPDQDNCQYVDIKCPLNCHKAIPKNKIEQHVAKECVKRPFTCQHCNFKATFKEVMDGHLPECKFVPLQCPNFCGVTFERDFLEDHMKICRLQEVRCEFSRVGCDEQFTREDQEEHIRQNSHKHLILTTSLALETKEQLLKKMLEQDKKHKEEKKLSEKIEKQENRIRELEKKLEELNKELGKQKEMFNSVVHEKEIKQLQLHEDLCGKEKKINELEMKLMEQEMEQKKAVQTIKLNFEESNICLELKLKKYMMKLNQKLVEQEEELMRQKERFDDKLLGKGMNLKPKPTLDGWKGFVAEKPEPTLGGLKGFVVKKPEPTIGGWKGFVAERPEPTIGGWKGFVAEPEPTLGGWKGFVEEKPEPTIGGWKGFVAEPEPTLGGWKGFVEKKPEPTLGGWKGFVAEKPEPTLVGLKEWAAKKPEPTLDGLKGKVAKTKRLNTTKNDGKLCLAGLTKPIPECFYYYEEIKGNEKQRPARPKVNNIWTDY